jgi:transposase
MYMTTTHIGIDLHKRTQTWVALSEDGTNKLFTREFPVTPEGVLAGITLSKSIGSEKLVVAIEPVCGWMWVVTLLRGAGMEVHISNPRKVKAIADSLQKTDENDAHILARLCKTGLMYESVEVSPKMRKLRSLVRERSFLIRIRASMKCRLEGVVTRTGRHVIHGSLSTKKGTNAIIASGEDEWKRSLRTIADMSAYIKGLDMEIAQYSKESIPTLLMSIPGVGAVTAVSIWAEVGDFSRFPSAEKLCAFAGLVPTERSSGGVQRLGHITHAGSTILRYVLVESAMRVRDMEKSTVLYDFYKRVKEKRGAMRGRVALARKILSIAWYMIRKGQKYEQRFSTQLSV